LPPPTPPITSFYGHGITGHGALGGLNMTPYAEGEGPPDVTPVPEPGAYLMLLAGLALLYRRLCRRLSMPPRLGD
jgi:hypothetical protein